MSGFMVKSDDLMKARSFERVFDVHPLSNEESREIELLLFDNYQPSRLSEEQVGDDFKQICMLTAEIRAINKQQIILIGERIYKARELFKNYGDGVNTFTKWLEKLFGSKRSAYNFLNYYEFYSQMPSMELKSTLKKMPLKAAYCLANRQAPFDKKLEIIRSYSNERLDDLILLIKEQLPTPEHDRRRKNANQVALDRVKYFCDILRKRKNDLSIEDKKTIQEIIKEFQKVL